MIERRGVWLGLVPVLVIALVGCVGAEEDVASVEAPIVESEGLPAHFLRDLAHPERCGRAQLDRVITLHHDVRVGRHRYVHVTERFTLRAWLHRTHRGVLMLPGTIVNGSFYELDVDGYRFASDLAERGFFTFAIDSEGSGESSYPADGATVTHAFLVDEAEAVLRALGTLRRIPRMDIFGESNGGAVAAELCADRRRTRSCVLASMIYAEGTPFFQAVFQDPAFLAYLSSQPNNYLDVTPDLYFNIASRTSPEVTAEILATQPGRYATPPLTVAASLPWFDPSHARVPALIIQGTEDNVATQDDSDMLAADYGSARGAGGVATIVRIEGGGHVPRIEPAPVSDAYRDAVFTFLGTP